MIYVYALCDGPPPALTGTAGLEQQPLAALEASPVAAVYSRHASASPHPTPDNAWCHEAVVEALGPDRAVLPVRFGTTFPDLDALGAVLRCHRRWLQAGLDRVRGCVELGVRVLWTAPAEPRDEEPAPGAAPGRAYLLARLAEQRRSEPARARAEHLHRQLAAVAAEYTRPGDRGGQLLSGAYLVPRGAVGAFRRRLDELGRADPQVRVLCTGPWPPYHFVPQIPLGEPMHA